MFWVSNDICFIFKFSKRYTILGFKHVIFVSLRSFSQTNPYPKTNQTNEAKNGIT